LYSFEKIRTGSAAKKTAIRLRFIRQVITRMKSKNIICMLAVTAVCITASAGCKEEYSISKKPYRSVPKAEYTKEAPDEWAGLEGEHLPVITFNEDRDPDISIMVNLTNPGRDHYIEKIGIIDGNNKELAVEIFTTNDKIFEAQFSSFTLPADKEKLKVFVKCSLHDLWTAPLMDSRYE
jgi:desulfoferrodoxin (superoxide reductase-like protein)